MPLFLLLQWRLLTVMCYLKCVFLSKWAESKVTLHSPALWRLLWESRYNYSRSLRVYSNIEAWSSASAITPSEAVRHRKFLIRLQSDIITTSGSPSFTHLIAIVVHSHQAQQMVHVPTLAKFAHQLWLDAFVLQDAFVAWWHDQPFHADGTVLE